MRLVLGLALFCSSFLTYASYQGLGEESLSPEQIEKFSPKPLPAVLARKVELMLDLRAPGLGGISPDGKSVFFNWAVTGVSQVWRLDSPLGFPQQMTAGQDQTVREELTPDGRYVIISRDRGGEENPGLYLQDVKGGELKLIQHIQKVQTRYEFVSPDSRYVYFCSNDQSPESFALYRYDIKEGKRELLFSEKGVWFVADHKENGEFILGKQVGSRHAEFYLWSLSKKELKPLLGLDDNEEYSVKFSSKASEYLVLTPKFGEFARLYLLKKDVKESWKALTPDLKMDITNFSPDEIQKRIYLELNDEGRTRTRILDAKTFKEIPLPKLPPSDQVSYGGLTKNGRYVTFGLQSASFPLRSYLYDWKTKKLTQWIDPSTPETDLSKFVPATLEYYPAKDGTKIPMFVRRPLRCAKELCPVVVEFHGGPEGQSTPSFSLTAQLFIDAGFIYVLPNVRGSEGYGKSWLNADNGAKRLEVISDIEDCAKFIKANWKFKGQSPKVGISGASYGGYSTLAAMTMFAGAYDAGVARVGMSDLRTFLKNTAPYRRALRASEYGDLEKDNEVLKKLSPITYLEKAKDPLMIIQGLNDPRVPAGEAVQMYEALQKKGVDSDLIIFADEGHGPSKRSNRVLQIGHMLQFFEKHLKGKPDLK